MGRSFVEQRSVTCGKTLGCGFYGNCGKICGCYARHVLYQEGHRDGQGGLQKVYPHQQGVLYGAAEVARKYSRHSQRYAQRLMLQLHAAQQHQRYEAVDEAAGQSKQYGKAASEACEYGNL